MSHEQAAVEIATARAVARREVGDGARAAEFLRRPAHEYPIARGYFGETITYSMWMRFSPAKDAIHWDEGRVILRDEFGVPVQ